jgi:hypothetical protein
MWEMNVTFRRVHAQWCIDNPKPDWFGVGPGTAGDIITVLHSRKHNPEGIPLLIHGKLDGMLNISDIDVWMRLKKLSPKSRPVNMLLKAPLISLFSEPGRWINFVDPREYLTPQGDTLRLSITSPFPIRGCDTSTIWASYPDG